ncbi:MAG: tetratricopeptide repeat protein [Candidatus Eisenbacteria bacterium]
MEKAIEIKRRAQRCIQNGDLDGALAEYEKLVQSEDSDPYNFVLLADLLFKRGDNDTAVMRYLSAVSAYETAGLYKNATAVCKKMMRLSLAPAKVLERLAHLHALDGLATEAALYFMQYAESLVRGDEPLKAAEALRKAFDASPDEVKALERLSEAYVLAGETELAAGAMAEAVYAHARLGRLDAAAKCRQRAEQLKPGAFAELEAQRGPIAGLDAARRRSGTGEKEVEQKPAKLPASEPATAKGKVSARADAETEAGATEELAVDEVDETESDARAKPGGPPRLPDLAAVDESPEPEALADPESIDGVIANEGSEAVDETPMLAETDSDFERFPSGISARPGVRFDSPGTGKGSRDDDLGVLPVGAMMGPDDEPEIAEEAGSEEYVEEPAAEEYAEETAAEEYVEEPAAETEPVAEESAEPEPEPSPAPVPARAAPTAAAGAARPTVSDIERLLARAQEQFRAGDREAAGELLVEAAVAYERIGRLDNAASIFRSLARGPQATPRLLALWLANAERRSDRAEAAEVACELGDRAVNDNDLPAARRWFERACDFDPDNAVARRRLSRLAQLTADVEDAAIPAGAASAPIDEPAMADTQPAFEEGENGRVEMALGRAEAVTFDLGSLLAEFQRGIEAQLSGDAQSHYDLAMTYREMGLHDQAVESFRLAAQDPAFVYRAAEMIGRCLLEQGRFADAARELDEALRSPHVPHEAALGLRYQLGLAHEAAGDPRAALAEFERVFSAQANYSDVALKLRLLRQSLESA